MLLSSGWASKKEGWSVLIWFCFQTTWCIRSIKISASHSLIALWVSAAGPGPGLGFLVVRPTLWGQVIYFGSLPRLKNPCFSECVSGVGARSKTDKRQVKSWTAACSGCRKGQTTKHVLPPPVLGICSSAYCILLESVGGNMFLCVKKKVFFGILKKKLSCYVPVVNPLPLYYWS